MPQAFKDYIPNDRNSIWHRNAKQTLLNQHTPGWSVTSMLWNVLQACRMSPQYKLSAEQMPPPSHAVRARNSLSSRMLGNGSAVPEFNDAQPPQPEPVPDSQNAKMREEILRISRALRAGAGK